MAYKLKAEESTRTGLVWYGYTFEASGLRLKKTFRLSHKLNPQTDFERQQKKEVQLLAKERIHALNLEYYRGCHDLPEVNLKQVDFFKFAFDYVRNVHSQKVKDIKKHIGVLKKLQRFVKRERLFCFELTKDLLERFAKYLESCLKGESVHSYFVRLRQVIEVGVEKGYFRTNPAAKIRVKAKNYRSRDVLNQEELKHLLTTPINNSEIRRAFAVSNITGLRWVDIKQLQWKHIRNGCICIIQQKTKVALEIPLNDDVQILLGVPLSPESKVFDLPSHTAAMKWLRRWTSDAGIEKHVTWHTARRNAATRLIANGTPITTVSRILGHTSIVNTQIYVNTSAELKREAIEKLPSILD